MDELISKKAAIDAMAELQWRASSKGELKGISNAWKRIKELPPIQPKRGRWIKLDMHRGLTDHKCTACKQECYVPTCMGEPMYAYCPNCGAKMEVNHESN